MKLLKIYMPFSYLTENEDAILTHALLDFNRLYYGMTPFCYYDLKNWREITTCG